MSMPRIFISHSHQDDVWCQELVTNLQALNCDVWIDQQGLPGGVVWISTIERELNSRDIFLLIVTPESWTSEWVQEELRLALAKRKHILPLLLKPTPVDGFILNRQWIEVGAAGPEKAAKLVITTLEGSSASFKWNRTPSLIIRQGRDIGQAFLLMTPSTTIGYDKRNMFKLTDKTVSAFHAVISYDAEHDQFTLRDDMSSNGTMLNGVEIPYKEERLLTDGDILTLGRVVLQFTFIMEHQGKEPSSL